MKTFVIGLVIIACLFPSLNARAEPTSAAMDFGYRTYFLYHPPKDKALKYNLYPFTGPAIQVGQDIPVCDAARKPEAYARKRDVKYILHGKDGWLFRTIDFRTDFTASPQTMSYFGRLNRLLASQGQTLIIAFQPPRAVVSSKHIDPADKPAGYTVEKALENYRAFLKQLDDAGIMTVDLSDVSPDIDYFSKGDFHWTPAGSGDTAKKLSSALKRLPAYWRLDKQTFDSEVTGLAPASRGAFEEFIQQTCQTNIELTAKPVWTTHSETVGKNDAASLLDNNVFPAITVVGTSNSAEDDKFNFVGALKHFARTDIYNAALTGGGFGASSYRYYASDEYHTRPPKIVIWEFLPQHNYNNTESVNAFRQMIPAIYGACDKEKAVAQYAGDITQGQTEFFSDIRNKSIRDTYLYLEVTEPKERNLKVDVLYSNGNVDQAELTRSTRMENNGKYYFELAGAENNNALAFHVITDVPHGHMTARICSYPVNVAAK